MVYLYPPAPLPLRSVELYNVEAGLKGRFVTAEPELGCGEYAPLFSYCRGQKEAQGLGDDFDSRILVMTEDKPAPVKARTVTLGRRLMPLFRAAAVVAIVLTIGNAAYMAVGDRSGGRDDINYANYKDTFTDPAVAYDEVESALQLVTEGISSADTTSSATPGGAQTPARR